MSLRAIARARARSVLWAIMIAASITAIGWRWYTQPYRDAKRVGVDAERLRRSGGCVSVRGEISCVTAFRPTLIPDVQEQVDIDPWTRSLLQARRSWWMADSAKWAASIDSIRRTALEAGGQALPCDASATGFPVAEAWALGTRELRLYAAEPIEAVPPGNRWYISFQLVPHRSAGCDLYLTRRPTIAEMDSMFRAWMREHLTF